MKTIDIAELEKWFNEMIKDEYNIEKWESGYIPIYEIKDFLIRQKALPEPCCRNCSHTNKHGTYYYCDKLKWAMISDFYCRFHEWRKAE